MESSASVSLDFETANQYSNSFRAFLNGSLITQTNLGEANDFVRLKSTVGLNNTTTVYDITPADDLEKSFFTVT